MVIDNSASQNLNCEALPVIALDALSGMHIGKRSRISIFTLGSPVSSWEPVKAIDMAAPRKGGSMFGGSFTDELKKACAGFAQVDSSSIFRALQVAVEHLRGEGCGEAGVPCKLVIESDGEENVTRAFYAPAGGEGKGVPSINNTGIRVIWCGYAVTDGGGAPRGERTNALLTRWRAAFTEPSNVTFKPFCAGTGPTRNAAIKGARNAR